MTQKEKPLGFAMIGCGRIAERHAGLLTSGEVKGARLVAVCDVIAERAHQMGKKYGVPHYLNMHEMIARNDADIDIILIVTPSGLHAKHTLEVVHYGKHICVEKPMALTLDDADDMIRACDINGVKLFVVKQNRYNLPVQKTWEALQEGRFGKLVMGTVRVRWSRPQAYYDQDAWRGTWAMDGGVFTNQASHHIDLLLWMMGEPITVFAKSRTALVDIETEDTGVAVIGFRNGAIGVVEATTAVRPRNLEGSVSILGEGGSVEIGGFAVNEMRTWKFAGHDDEEAEVLSKYKENPPDVYGYGHRIFLNHVADAVRSDGPTLVDGLEGRRSLELIAGIYESIETGREEKLRFMPRQARLGRQDS